MIVNTLGRKWETTFTTLVTFGGAFFASFPLFYATSFGGAYWVWIAILLSFTIQAIAYEYRSKPNNVLGQKTYDLFLFLNGSLGPFLIGVAVATFFTGAMFSLNQMNQVLSLGFAVLFLCRINGLLYIIFSIDDNALFKRSVKALVINSVPFLIFFIFFTISLLVSNGHAVDYVTGSISIEKFKYFHNLLQMPVVLLLFLVGVVNVLLGIGITVLRTSKHGIWFTGTGTVLTVFALFIIAGFNGTSFYPSLHDVQSSLTINNASSSHFTLKTMMFVSFIIPLILVYIWYAWKAINKDKITEEEMNTGEHNY
jgi:cytochrome d ubiquinol oxidase subunit II